MANTHLTGTASVYGVDGSLSYGGVLTNGAQIIHQLSLSEDVEKDDLKDGSGEIRAKAYKNAQRHVTVEFVPIAKAAGNTIANAISATALPTIPSKVTVAITDSSGASLLNADYLYEGGGSITLSEGYARMSLPVVGYISTPIANPATAFSTLVS